MARAGPAAQARSAAEAAITIVGRKPVLRKRTT
jgi:hypothetical protein